MVLRIISNILLMSLLAFPAFADSPSVLNSHSNHSFKVGVILPLTGGWASWGERIRQGILLSVKTLQHPIEVQFDDEGTCEAQLGVRAARKFFAEGIKVLIIGCVATTKALLQEAARRDVLLFSAGLLDRESFASDAKVVSFATQVGTEAKYQADYIVQQGYKSVGLVRPLEAFGEELAVVLKTELKRQGVRVLFDDSDSFSTNDFGPTLLQIQRNRPEVVVINLGESQQIAFMKRIRGSGSNVPVLSTYGLESNSTSSDNLVTLEGVTYTYPYNQSAQTAEKLRYDLEFSKKYGAEVRPNANVYFVHDGLHYLDRALTDCTGKDSACIFRFFTTLGTQSGLAGSVTFLPDGSTDRPYKLKRVVNGHFTWIE